MKKITVLLADDHPVVRDGVKAILRQHSEIEVVGEAANGEEVIAFVQHRAPDVVVLDINMPKMDGIACARKLKKEFPQVKIVMLTMYAQKTFLEEIIRLGIDGCLLKNNSAQELGAAIIRVADNKSYYDRIQSFQPEREDAEPSVLSPRELEILRFIAEGLTTLQIADRLCIAEHTVKTHRKNILKKTGAGNASELFQFALNRKLI
jgi:DNA-binding NarL/FixJ family response regulator